MTNGHITAAWSGLDYDRATVLWAADWADRTGRGLRVVHGRDESGGDPGPELFQMRNLLRHMALAFPTLVIEGRGLSGDLVQGLLSEALSAELVVVGTGTCRFPRLSGAHAAHLAAISPCPVVMVPHTWRGYHDSEPARTVSTLSAGAAARAAIRCAVREAALAGIPVEFARVRGAGSTVTRDAHAYAEMVGALHSDIEIRTAGEARDSAAGLLELVGSDALLVIGCHHSDDPSAVRLGPIARAIQATTLVPVVFAGRCPADDGMRPRGQSVGEVTAPGLRRARLTTSS